MDKLMRTDALHLIHKRRRIDPTFTPRFVYLGQQELACARDLLFTSSGNETFMGLQVIRVIRNSHLDIGG